jgi:hypothetical protein
MYMVTAGLGVTATVPVETGVRLPLAAERMTKGVLLSFGITARKLAQQQISPAPLPTQVGAWRVKSPTSITPSEPNVPAFPEIESVRFVMSTGVVLQATPAEVLNGIAKIFPSFKSRRSVKLQVLGVAEVSNTSVGFLKLPRHFAMYSGSVVAFPHAPPVVKDCARKSGVKTRASRIASNPAAIRHCDASILAGCCGDNAPIVVFLLLSMSSSN